MLMEMNQKFRSAPRPLKCAHKLLSSATMADRTESAPLPWSFSSAGMAMRAEYWLPGLKSNSQAGIDTSQTPKLIIASAGRHPMATMSGANRRVK